MNNDENLDLLDLDDGASLDVLPDATPFVAPRPRRPWLLMGIGLVVILLATYIIIRVIGTDGPSEVDIDLDAPTIVMDVPSDAPKGVPVDMPGMVPMHGAEQPVMPVPDQVPPAPNGDPVTMPMPEGARPVMPVPPVSDQGGVPVRVIEDRRDVSFNPDAVAAAAPAPKPVTAPAPAPKKASATKPVAKKPAQKKPAAPKAQSVAAANGGWYVQLGSYSTRALAENAGNQMVKQHSSLFAGHQFTVLAATTNIGAVYRLRVPFASSAEANGFCRNAKSDGIDCYVTK